VVDKVADKKQQAQQAPPEAPPAPPPPPPAAKAPPPAEVGESMVATKRDPLVLIKVRVLGACVCARVRVWLCVQAWCVASVVPCPLAVRCAVSPATTTNSAPPPFCPTHPHSRARRARTLTAQKQPGGAPMLSEERRRKQEKPLDSLVQAAAVDPATAWRRVFQLGR
jgi:rRNA maturation protein Nop10